MMCQQQLLPLSPQVPLKLGEQWIAHAQVEAAHGRLALWMVQGGLLWLKSEMIAGKTHFVRGLCAEHPQLVYLHAAASLQPTSVRQLKVWLDRCEHQAFWVLDLPAGALPAPLAYAVFHLIERAKALNRALLICWRCADLQQALPELSSRLLMMEPVLMAEPDCDHDLESILTLVLQRMQWQMKASVLRALLLHVPRRLADLLAAIAKLDHYSKLFKVDINAALAIRILTDEAGD